MSAPAEIDPSALPTEWDLEYSRATSESAPQALPPEEQPVARTRIDPARQGQAELGVQLHTHHDDDASLGPQPSGYRFSAGQKPDAAKITSDWVAQPDPDALIGQTVGSYTIVRLLGQGGLGSVYLAEHPTIRSKVAIKILHPDVESVPGIGKRFEREARAANLVNSEHVVSVLDFGKLEDGRSYAVMEYLDGESVGAYLARTGPLSVATTLIIVQQIAKAMSMAHARGIVHRDLKPENLFIEHKDSGDFLVRILDFGIARIAEERDALSQTPAGMPLGTPRYCSPEQAAGLDSGAPSDVYSLGTIAYELLTQTPLFPSKNVVELLQQKLRGEVLRLDALHRLAPRKLIELLRNMLASAPEQRPSMQLVFATVQALLRVPEIINTPTKAQNALLQQAPQLRKNSIRERIDQAYASVRTLAFRTPAPGEESKGPTPLAERFWALFAPAENVPHHTRNEPFALLVQRHGFVVLAGLLLAVVLFSVGLYVHNITQAPIVESLSLEPTHAQTQRSNTTPPKTKSTVATPAQNATAELTDTTQNTTAELTDTTQNAAAEISVPPAAEAAENTTANRDAPTASAQTRRKRQIMRESPAHNSNNALSSQKQAEPANSAQLLRAPQRESRNIKAQLVDPFEENEPKGLVDPFKE